MSVKIKTVLHEFFLGDVDDPQIYAAEPLWQWQQTEAGQWAMQNCVETPSWSISTDRNNWGHRVTISGNLLEHDHTYFKLKFYDYTKHS